MLSTPLVFDAMGRVGGLAGDGRCKPFAAAADGTGWSEGVGLLLLERLADAEANGHEVLATIRGSATNQDGASNGITAPNGPAQEQVIRAALDDAGLVPAAVDAVEAHGTGTALGDPIEAGALLATYGRGREDAEPLRLGSIKSNLGHTQAAAGVAGVIKMALALRHGVLPRTLHVDRPSPHVDWAAGRVELLTEPVPWERGERPRRAGVSSFGASGTNAHLILEEAPAPAPAAAGEGEAGSEDVAAWAIAPLPLSAADETALRELAGRLREHLLAHPEQSEAEVARSLVETRPLLAHRAAASGADREQLLAGLAAIAAGAEADNAYVATAPAAVADGPVFLFPGQGAQWRSMAIELLSSSPLFAAAIDECEQALEPHVEWSLAAILRREEGTPDLERVDVVQPVLFAVSVALARLWRASGVEPAAVLGHSQGEIAAVHVAGGLSLEEAAELIARRSQVLVQGTGNGSMALAAASAATLSERVPGWDDLVSLGGVNGPNLVVVSGPDDGIDEVLARCEEAGIWNRRIRAAVGAGHSPAIEAGRELLLEAAAGISPRAGAIPFYSCVSAGQLDTAGLDAEYWYRNARETVRFGPAVSSLLAAGFRRFVEVSPNPILMVPLHEAFAHDLGAAAAEASFTPTLRHRHGALHDFGRAVGTAWANGVAVDWDRALAPARPVRLPTYPFQRRPFWLAPPAATFAGAEPAPAGAGTSGGEPEDESLLQRLAPLSPPEREEAALEFVRAQLAELLSLESAAAVDPERPFLELGFDSLTALQYRGRLNRLLGFELDLRAALDYPTPAALSAHIVAQVGDGETPAAGAGAGTLAALLGNAQKRGEAGELVGLLGSLARFRPTFAAAEEAGEPFSVRLATGEAEPLLVFVPSLLPTSGPHEYAKLARAFESGREVAALRWPGFRGDEPLPAGVEAALELQVAAVEAAAAGRPFVLAGHSTGGAFAYAIAQRLQQLGRPAAGVAMIDSYHPLQTRVGGGGEGGARAIGIELLGRMLARDELAAAVDDDAITATALYVQLLAAVEIAAIEAPVLLIQASELPGADPGAAGARPRWEVPHELAAAPGNHLSMMDAHAEETAAAISDWIQAGFGGAHKTQATKGKEVHT